MPANASTDATQSDTIAAKLAEVKARIEAACLLAGRAPEEVNLLAVSKTKPLEAVTSAFGSGQRHFGENYLQDALTKIDAAPEGAIWHFIGAIQSNKTRPIAENFDWVHTVSSAKVARRLHEQRPAHLPALNIFLQVNIDGDPNKSGTQPDQLPDLIKEVRQYERLALKGLMALPEQTHTLESQRKPFCALRQLQNTYLSEAKELSMGMSGDLEAAIMEGATWVRIGTDIFGARELKT